MLTDFRFGGLRQFRLKGYSLSDYRTRGLIKLGFKNLEVQSLIRYICGFGESAVFLYCHETAKTPNFNQRYLD